MAMGKAKIAFKEIASRITGISIPIFGLSWNPPESEREIVRETLIFLEDRRALYNDFAHEIEHEVAESVLQIRTEITSQAVEKRPSAAFCSSLVTAAYLYLRLIPRDFAGLASGHFPSACEQQFFNMLLTLFGKMTKLKRTAYLESGATSY